MKPASAELLNIFSSNKYRGAQRGYNGLFSFTALGAGGIQKRSWTQPQKGPSMLCLHGKAYHRIFDLQQQYQDMAVSNSSRFYIYDSEFVENCSSQNLDQDIANVLRTHMYTNVKWAQEYRSAVDLIQNNDSLNNPQLPPPYIEFAEVSRSNDGPVLGEQVSAPEIAALVYTSGQQDRNKRAVVTYPINSPDPKPRFLPLWSPAYETLQFPLLFLHGEAGWSKGNARNLRRTNRKL